jgi:hypothetical protein
VILRIVQKDWRLLWPMVALVSAIQVGLEWAVFSSGLFGEDPAAAALLRPLTLAWFVATAGLTAAVVHQDAIPGVDQDWLIRPLRRTQLLLAKLGFVAVSIGLPMFASNLADALASGFPWLPSIKAVLFKELFVFACFIVPVLALASLTRQMSELIMLGVALVVAFAVSLGVSGFAFGTGWCPTCSSGTAWMQHMLQHLGVLLGAGIILWLQYYRRSTDLSRALAVVGAVGLVFAQLPWNIAFAIEHRIAGLDTAEAGVNLQLAPDTDLPSAAAAGVAAGPAGVRPMGAASPGARDSTRALLNGRVDPAMQYLQRRARSRDASVAIELPLRTSGISADELLLADRSEIRLFDSDRRLMFRTDTAGALAILLTPVRGRSGAAPQVSYQSLDIPGKIYRQAASGAQLQLDYSLTLMKPAATYKLDALAGELQAPQIGRCATMADRDAVYLRCKSIAQPPFCYSATLYGPDGRSNPEVLKCTPDYRRSVPQFLYVLGIYGVDLPLHDRSGTPFGIDVSELGRSYVLFKIYEERDHFTRRLDVSQVSLDRWRAPAAELR